jgi:hypothetical protein
MLPGTGTDPKGQGISTTGPDTAGRKRGSARTTGDDCFVREAAERNIAAGDGAGIPTTGGASLQRYSGVSFADGWGEVPQPRSKTLAQ